MKKTKITDANGKTFEVSLSDITDINGDKAEGVKVDPNDKSFIKMKDFVAPIVDSNEQPVNITDLLQKIQDGKATMPAAIDVLFEATHSGVNLNSWNYSSDSFQKDCNSWLSPFAKPMLKNHDSFEEPLGRATKAYVGPSDFNDERDCINVSFHITDTDAIPKFLDGRYKTMSIGANASDIKCSICGKHILKDGRFKFCGHWRGETYDGQKAVWTATGLRYAEGSIVNEPADLWAQVKKITICSSENKDGENNDNDQNSIGGIVDGLINNQTNTGSSIQDNQGTQDPEQKGAENQQNADCGQHNDPKPEDKDIQIKELQDKVDDLTQKLSNKDSEIETFTTQVKTLTDSNNALKKEKDKLDGQLADCKNNALKISISYKKSLAKRISDFEISDGKLTADKCEDRINLLMAESTQKLIEMNDSLVPKKITAATVPSIQNPSFANKDDKHNTEVTNTDTNNQTHVSDGEQNIKTINDRVEEIINIISR